MLRYLLDTITVSYALRGDPPAVRAHLHRVPMAQVCVSMVTEAELRFGVALKPQATRLAALVDRFLSGVTSVPWDSAAAQSYAFLAAASWQKGKRLAAVDLFIAAHAHALRLTLVTSDQSFSQFRGTLTLADWSKP
jgi:tRNA(fMet)-specific endonuclease VapC